MVRGWTRSHANKAWKIVGEEFGALLSLDLPAKPGFAGAACTDHMKAVLADINAGGRSVQDGLTRVGLIDAIHWAHLGPERTIPLLLGPSRRCR